MRCAADVIGGWRSARRLVVVRADNIGDVLMAGPALRAVREALPAARLTLLASPAGADAACLLPWVDEVVSWRVLWQDLGRLALDPAREWALIERLRQGRFDGAIILTSFSQTPHPAAFAAWLARIPLRAGASRERSGLLTHAVASGPDAQHQVDRNLALVEALGFAANERALEVRVPSSARERAQRLLAAHGLEAGDAYVLFNPWTSTSARTYPPDRGADAARRVACATGLRVVVTAHARDAERSAALARRIGPAAADLAGATSVADLAALVAGAALVITGNTSVMHMADALRRPQVVPFSGTDLPSQWTPRHGPYRLLQRPTPCSPCYAFTCPYDLECLDIAPDEVAAASLELLAAHGSLEPHASGAAPRRSARDRSGAAWSGSGSGSEPSGARDGAAEAAAAFWAHHERHGEPLRSSIERLADLALSEDPRLAAHSTRVLFDRIIEPLCDAFTAHDAETYRRVFTQIICAARRHPQCRALDVALAADGIRTEDDLLRASASGERPCVAPMPSVRPSLGPRLGDGTARVQSVIVLSRLTLGADVAIALPVLARMRRLFPRARIRFAGAEGARVLARFAGVEHCPVSYGRRDDLAARLDVWPDFRRVVAAAREGSSDEDAVVVDPDSRLTQLGLLAPCPRTRYFHFPSRTYGGESEDALSVLVRRWLDDVFGAAAGAEPEVRLSGADARWSHALREAAARGAPVASVSFGVGGNAHKRADAEFEARLVEWIVRRGWRVLLARGAGAAEVEQSRRLARRLERRGIAVLHLPPGRALAPLAGRTADVVTWEADVAAFFAAVACADAYVGYDSAGQHIAAALGVPTLSLFIESAGDRHAQRWAPRGSAAVRVVRCPHPVDTARLFDGACEAFAALPIGRPHIDLGAITA